MKNDGPRLVLLTGLGVTPFLVEPMKRRLPFRVETPAWIDPRPREPLERYAARMAKAIGPSERLYLGGISFGAVVALEAAKLLRPRGVFMVAGAYSWRDLSPELRVAFRLAQHVPDWLVRAGQTVAPLGLRYFGTLDRCDWRFFRELLRDHVRIGLGRWAAGAMLEWEFEGPAPCPVYHVHGGDDRAVPLRRSVRPDRVIPRGGHVIHVHDVEEVARFITERIRMREEEDEFITKARSHEGRDVQDSEGPQVGAKRQENVEFEI